MANLLNAEVKTQVREVFDELKHPTQVLFFGQKNGCEFCDDTQQLVEEVVELSDRLSLEVYDLDEDAGVAKNYRVDKAPGLVIAGREEDQVLDFGIRYAGIPSGHEFSSFIHDLVLVSQRDSGLSQKTRDFLSKLGKPVHLQVFVTPT